ncbi:TonB-dependent receptor plug domain-containing protein [Desulfonatronum thioautotrophicum]|uniref:TonB-dependent receptor plug domain-containing protein n=1 Tax=Desulfonatronum thioautotrophicum TaxID=617001 RepID=UPI00069AB54F|nr:TonB-dependent receptor [Desulfonatronum thioautotrophicum]
MKKRIGIRVVTISMLSCLFLLPGFSAWGTPRQAEIDPLEMSLEELMQVVVTSVAKKEQTLWDTAAAVYVISNEDIRRSGAKNIPEALRMAPGVQVSAIANNKWAISIRGFAERFSNKLLVLVDGRSVYSPLFSGVFWEALDVPLELIERIEVIRGPGSAIWGVNAVNGVINIITKLAEQSEGGRISLATGSELRHRGFVGYGSELSEQTYFRLHALTKDTAPSRFVGGGKAEDDWQLRTVGLRLDHAGEFGSMMIQSSLNTTNAGDESNLSSSPPRLERVVQTQEIDTGYLLGRWEHERSQQHSRSFQFAFEHFRWDNAVLAEKRSTVDLEYQERWRGLPRHDVIWGLGYRISWDDISNTPTVVLEDGSATTHLYSIFVQDEISITPDNWKLVLGARLDHNEYTGFELQPNARLLWTPNEFHSLWMALSRAVRTPSRTERAAIGYNMAQPESQPPSVVTFFRHLDRAEQVHALDAGWRHQLLPSMSMDIATFYYRYNQLRDLAIDTPEFQPPGFLNVPVMFTNQGSATTTGLEVSLDWRPFDIWRLEASMSLLRIQRESTQDRISNIDDEVSPTRSFSLRSSLDLSSDLQLDAWIRSFNAIKQHDISGFTTLDLRLGWQARDNLELFIVGQNLLRPSHPEFVEIQLASTPTEVQRSFYFGIDWRF